MEDQSVIRRAHSVDHPSRAASRAEKILRRSRR
jgi:hypothetical protein